MKALIFVCLMFVGCYHEEKTDVPDVYETNFVSFISQDTCLVMKSGNKYSWLKLSPSQYAFGDSGKITITFDIVKVYVQPEN